MKDAFTADWLSLREAADHAARPAAATSRLAQRFAAVDHICVLDLGAGTGSNLRFLAPRLPCRQHWTLVDHDAGLLERARAACRSAADSRGRHVEITTAVLALSELERLDLSRFDLVTAAALLDLVTAEWLGRAAALCRDAGATVLFALNYDGSAAWTPAEPGDDAVRSAVNAHQRRDKGLGPALGPDAATNAAQALGQAGFHASRWSSSWHLGPDDGALQHGLLAGWAAAAAEQKPALAADIRHWTDRRRGHLARGASRVTVGHIDLLAEPAE